ncbi:exodeoxyribonuclease III [Bradyrhizobium sp. USDA 4519]
MRFSVTTWNINSVRLRIDTVAKFIKSARPDVLCLQETKCIDDAFPLKRFKRLGYEHVALNGQKGYHGVAIVSRLPFETTDIRTFCDKIDSRHISVSFGEKAQLSKPLVLHNFYVPAGGDIPDPALNPKFEHKLQFLDEMKACEPLHPRGDDRHILVGDLNVAPHENDVWVAQAAAQGGLAHAGRDREAARRAGAWRMVRHRARADPDVGKGLHLVELPRGGLDRRRSRPTARSHLGLARAEGSGQRFQDHPRRPQLGAPVGPRAGDGGDGGLRAPPTLDPSS